MVLAQFAIVGVVASQAGRTDRPLLTSATASPARFGGRANYILNPSFDYGADFWSPYGQHTSLTVVPDGGSRHAGMSTALSTLPFGVALADAVAFPQIGALYTFDVAVRSDPAGLSYTVQLGSIGAFGRVRILRKTAAIASARWRRTAVTARVPARSTGINAYVVVRRRFKSGARLYVTDGRLRRVS